MTYELNLKTISLPIAASIAAQMFYCFVLGAGGTMALQTTAGGRVDGIAQDDNAQAGTVSAFAIGGVSMGAVGAAVNEGDSVEVDATGRLITATGTAGHKVMGVALAAATGAGQLIPVQLRLVA
jgi:hypothetical protein